MQLKESRTYQNLKKAYVAECSARTRYEFVEYGQRMAGYESLARITDRIAYQEFNHARMLYTKIEDANKEIIDNEEIKVSLPFRQKWDMLENLISSLSIISLFASSIFVYSMRAWLNSW